MTGFIVVLLGLGIGANATMFGLVDRLLLRGPTAVTDPGHVVRFFMTRQAVGGTSATSDRFPYVSYTVARRNMRTFSGTAAYSLSTIRYGTITEPRSLPVGYASASFFPLLGVRPALGRFILDSEDITSAPAHVVVLGYSFWKREFAADRSVVGRQITIRAEPFTIVGVAPPGFNGVELSPVNIWLPLSVFGALGRPPSWPTNWGSGGSGWLEIVGRLRPGMSWGTADRDLTTAHRLEYTGPDKGVGQARIFVAALASSHSGTEPIETTVAKWLTVVSFLVLVIACANASNLMLARAIRRQGEVAVRVALGANTVRVTRLLLFEALIMVLTAGIAAFGIAVAGIGIIHQLAFPDIDLPIADYGLRVIPFCLVVAAATGALVALPPAIEAGRLDLVTSLRAGKRAARGTRSRLTTVLTAGQVTLSLVLMIGAGLFVRSFWSVNRLDLGIQPDRVLTVGFNWPRDLSAAQDPSTEHIQQIAVFSQTLERVRALPGVTHASVAIGVPLGTFFTVKLRVPGVDSIPLAIAPNVSAVSSDYFATVGTRIIVGRSFTSADGAGSQRVAVVSKQMAMTYWPGKSALGQCLLIDTMPCSSIVGVAADVRRHDLHEAPTMHYYVPLGQESGIFGPQLLVGTSGPPMAVLPAVRKIMLAVDPRLILSAYDGATMQASIDEQSRPWRLGATVFGAFGVLAILVATFGLYSIIARQVEERAPELALRRALGASHLSVLQHVMGRVLVVVSMSTVIGAGIAWYGSQLLQPVLFDTSAHDPWIFGVAIGSVFVAAIIAGGLPSWRATHLDPMTALRAD